MKANSIQRLICGLICSQANFWAVSNDITSPTHIVDIIESCESQLDDKLGLEDITSLECSLKYLYMFIRTFDNYK